MTLNQINEMFGLEPWEGGNQKVTVIELCEHRRC